MNLVVFVPLNSFSIYLYLCAVVFHLECRAEKEPPSTLLWALFLLAQVDCHSSTIWFLFLFFFGASTPSILIYLNSHVLMDSVLMQHYDRRGQYDIALSKIDEAMEHTPTVIDLYSAKVGLIHITKFISLCCLCSLLISLSMALNN